MQTNHLVYIIDDEVEILNSLSWLLETMGYQVKTYLNPNDFLEEPSLYHPSCLLIDVRMIGISGLEVQQTLISKGEKIPTIFMTGYDDVNTAVRAIKAGGFDFLSKPIHPQVLLDTINKAVNYDVMQARWEEKYIYDSSRFNELTFREKEIMKLLVNGLTNKEIAKSLKISPNTVELHRAKIMKKTKVKNIVELVNLAWRAGVFNGAASSSHKIY